MPDNERPWDKSDRRARHRDGDDEDDRRRDRRDRRADDWGDGDEDARDRRAARREHLLAVAKAQKGILICILIYFCMVVGQFAIPPEFRLWLAVALIPLGITATVFVFILATRLYGQGAGIVLGILTLVPLVGLIVLLVVNQRATKILNDADVRVGLLGANMSDIR
jgi:hypothetical protein